LSLIHLLGGMEVLAPVHKPLTPPFCNPFKIQNELVTQLT
jgi:hypothetical protein